MKTVYKSSPIDGSGLGFKLIEVKVNSLNQMIEVNNNSGKSCC